MSKTLTYKYDVFLSHSAKDKSLVRKLAERLRADKVAVWFDEWEIRPGDSIPAKIGEGIEESRILLLAMSANAFDSDWVGLEYRSVVFRDPGNRQRRFLTLRLDDSEIKDLLKHFLYIDWRDQDDGQYKKLLDTILRTDSAMPSDDPPKRKKRREETKKQGHISLNYARLFGAYQAAFLLNTEDYRGIGFNPRMNRFAKGWDYANAKPLGGRVWHELYGDGSEGSGVAEILLKIANQNDGLGNRYFDLDITWDEVTKFYLENQNLMPEEKAFGFLTECYREFSSLLDKRLKTPVHELIEKYLHIDRQRSGLSAEKREALAFRSMLGVKGEEHPKYDPEGIVFARKGKKVSEDDREAEKAAAEISGQFHTLIGGDAFNAFRQKILRFEKEHPEIFSLYWIDTDELEMGFESRPHSDYAFREIAAGSDYRPGEVLERLESNSSNIGFLVLYLENTSDFQLNDIKISFREFVKEDGFGTLISAAKVDEEIGKQKLRGGIIPYLKPRQQLFLILSVYLKDDGGYPRAYVSSVLKPVKLEYSAGDAAGKITVRIRKPLMDKAMKISLPFGWGWYYQ